MTGSLLIDSRFSVMTLFGSSCLRPKEYLYHLQVPPVPYIAQQNCWEFSYNKNSGLWNNGLVIYKTFLYTWDLEISEDSNFSLLMCACRHSVQSMICYLTILPS